MNRVRASRRRDHDAVTAGSRRRDFVNACTRPHRVVNALSCVNAASIKRSSPTPICMQGNPLDIETHPLACADEPEWHRWCSPGRFECEDHRSSDSMLVRQVVKIPKLVQYPVSQITDPRASDSERLGL